MVVCGVLYLKSVALPPYRRYIGGRQIVLSFLAYSLRVFVFRTVCSVVVLVLYKHLVTRRFRFDIAFFLWLRDIILLYRSRSFLVGIHRRPTVTGVTVEDMIIWVRIAMTRLVPCLTKLSLCLRELYECRFLCADCDENRSAFAGRWRRSIKG